MELLTVYETFLYYSCLLLIARNILCVAPNKAYMIGSFLAFIPLTIIAAIGTDFSYNIVDTVFVVAQFVMIKGIFKGIQLGYVVFSYIFMNCLNIIIISLIIPSPNSERFLIDVIVNSITCIACILICLTKVKYHIRGIIALSPKYMLLLSSLVLISVSIVSILLLGSKNSQYQAIWDSFSRTGLTILLLIMCAILPIFMLTAIAHNRLKALTANYEQQIQAQAEHYKNLAAANFETRRFKHDFKNMSFAMEALLAGGETAEALNLIRQWNDTLNAPGTFQPAFDTGNGIADALLTDKSEKASACNTEITFEGALPGDFLSPTDLCVILGNTLDNAMEACQKLTPEMRKTIAISCRCSSGFLFVSINNPVSQKVMIQDNHIVTTKENKTLHGFGLYSLHSVVKKYNGEVKLRSTDDFFTAEIELCIPASVMFMQKAA